jgi:hypothetical protein
MNTDHSYALVPGHPTVHDLDDEEKPNLPMSNRRQRYSRLIATTTCALLLFLAWRLFSRNLFLREEGIRSAELHKSWAQYSPYFPAAKYVRPPEGCEIIQVRGSNPPNLMVLPKTRYLHLGEHCALVYSKTGRHILILFIAQLQRHGARYPTLGAAIDIAGALTKLMAVTTYKDPKLEFLKTYEYILGVEDLVPFGAQE